MAVKDEVVHFRSAPSTPSMARPPTRVEPRRHAVEREAWLSRVPQATTPKRRSSLCHDYPRSRTTRITHPRRSFVPDIHDAERQHPPLSVSAPGVKASTASHRRGNPFTPASTRCPGDHAAPHGHRGWHTWPMLLRYADCPSRHLSAARIDEAERAATSTARPCRLVAAARASAMGFVAEAEGDAETAHDLEHGYLSHTRSHMRSSPV